MKIGITLEDGSGLAGNVCQHLGSCSHFLIVDIENGIATGTRVVPNTAQHGGGGCQAADELMKYNITHVISGGMGMNAQQIFKERHIPVFGFSGKAKDAIEYFMKGSLGDVGPCEGHGDCH